MITYQEINPKKYELPENIKSNIYQLLDRMNIIRRLYDKPMIVTSGYRSLKEHLDIYAKKGITDQSKIPMRSNHLVGLAVDIYDPTGELNKWCFHNEQYFIDLGLHLEFRQGPWQHFQLAAPKSGNLWFWP